MTVVKPKPDHPWRRGCIIKREVRQQISNSTTNSFINNYKVGGGLPSWNGRK
ncbi:hypothetical protein ACTID9_00890 [Brevibacillus fluminis]|uniref:hypothetical protein n=1 Tax=Brevibacillus fluminis TaxID=511487 RepID=UPI003F8BD40E